MNEVEIVTLPPDYADDRRVVAEITHLVNDVYAVAEKGLWLDDAARTTLDEVAGLIRAGEITVARVDGGTVGCIRIQRLDADTSEFGMLAASSDHRGIGVGRRLVDFAERDSLETDRGTMQLELLVPRAWAHPSKEFLAGWYERIGYAVTRTSTIDESYPQLAPLLATDCDFVIYRKDLTTSH